MVAKRHGHVQGSRPIRPLVWVNPGRQQQLAHSDVPTLQTQFGFLLMLHYKCFQIVLYCNTRALQQAMTSCAARISGVHRPCAV